MVSRSLPSSGSAFDIDAQAGVVFSRFFGTISPSEVLSHLIAVARDARFQPGMNTLADIRAARVDWSMRDIVEFRIMLFDAFQNRITGRWALLTEPRAESRQQAGMTKLVENLFLRVDARLFEDTGQAMRWLRDGVRPDSSWSRYWKTAVTDAKPHTFEQL